MEPVVIGSIVGALSRLAPEAVKLIDARSGRKHELQMAKLNLENMKVQQQGQLAVAKQQQMASYDVAALQALGDAIKAQATVTGVKWVDAMSASVRPVVTYLLLLMYLLTKGQPNVPYWSPEDQILFASVLNFWFLGRVLDRWTPGLK